MARAFTTGTREREWLRACAQEIAAGLEAQPIGRIHLNRSISVPRAPYTDGWCATLGGLSVPGTDSVAAFVDRMAGGAEPRLWIGFFVEGTGRCRRIAQHLTRHWSPVSIFRNDRYAEQHGHTVLRPRLRPREFDRPIAELFSQHLKDIGIYWSDRIDWRTRASPKLVRKSVRFLAETLSALESFSTPRVGPRHQVFRNTAVTVTSRVFRRSRAQARKALERDRWICQICRLDPVKRYGVEGRRCLDAHHLEPLHARTRRHETRLADLITVCATCHRVLHALPRGEREWRNLRRRFAP